MLILPTPYENAMHHNQTFYKRTVTIDPPPQHTPCGILKIMTIKDDPLVEHDIVTKFYMYSDCHVSHLTVAKSHLT